MLLPAAHQRQKKEYVLKRTAMFLFLYGRCASNRLHLGPPPGDQVCACMSNSPVRVSTVANYASTATRRPLRLDSSAAMTMAKLLMLSWHSFIGVSPVRSALTKSASDPAIPSPLIVAGPEPRCARAQPLSAPG